MTHKNSQTWGREKARERYAEGGNVRRSARLPVPDFKGRDFTFTPRADLGDEKSDWAKGSPEGGPHGLKGTIEGVKRLFTGSK